MLEETEERLASIDRIEADISDILVKGAAAIDALAAGKEADTPAHREAFETSIEQYQDLVSDVQARLRAEMIELWKASRTTLLPVSAPVKAVAFGDLKESEIWQEVASSVKSGTPTDKTATNDAEDAEMADE